MDHYLLAVMFAVSVASAGLQATQDRLICIPAVNCSDLARNDSVVRKWSEFSDVSDICNQSSSLVVLTKMPDRRYYDYVDNECYKKMHWFSAYYSLIFLAETVVLLGISNFWHKYPNTASALAHCEHLLSEFTKGDILVSTDDKGPRETEKKETKPLLIRLALLEECYGQNSSVTVQYRLRGVVGLIFAIASLAFSVGFYSLSTGWTQCHLDDHVAFSTEHTFFQCTRFMGMYFHAGSILLIVLLFLHLIFVLGSILWSVTGERREPRYTLLREDNRLIDFKGDAAFLFHFIHQSNSSFLITAIRRLLVSGKVVDVPVEEEDEV